MAPGTSSAAATATTSHASSDSTGLQKSGDAGSPFTIPDDFDLDAHLQDSWKMFKGDGNHKVHLRFDKSLAPLILNARHHPDEHVKQRRDGSVDYKVELNSLEEIARWIVGFGGKCRVVGPGDLRHRTEAIATGVLGHSRSNP